MTIWSDIASAYGAANKGLEDVEKGVANEDVKSDLDIASWLGRGLIPGVAASDAQNAEIAKTTAARQWANEHPGQGEFNQDVSPDQASEDAAGAQDNPKSDSDSSKGKTTTTTPESAYEQLADAQADQYLAASKQLDPLTSGSAITSVDSNMSQGAEAMLGTSSTSPVSQWLNQQTQAAQAQYAPVASANASLASAEQSGQQLIAGGIQQMGQAETAEMQSAPYSQLLQSLASDVPYKLLDNYNFTNLTGPNVPQGLKLAENNLDITATGQTGGSTPVLPPVTGNAAANQTLTTPDLPSGGGQT